MDASHGPISGAWPCARWASREASRSGNGCRRQGRARRGKVQGDVHMHIFDGIWRGLGCFLALEKNARNGPRAVAARVGVMAGRQPRGDRGARGAAGHVRKTCDGCPARVRGRRQFDEIWNGGNWAAVDELYARNTASHESI